MLLSSLGIETDLLFLDRGRIVATIWSDFCLSKVKTILKAMKIIFTFLFIAIFLMSGFAQNASGIASKNTTFISDPSSALQPFVVEKVYPNPVKDLVYVDIQSKTASPVLINLYNILGTEVKKWESVELHEGTQKIKLDLSELKSGLYILKFSTSGQTYSQMVKKN